MSCALPCPDPAAEPQWPPRRERVAVEADIALRRPGRLHYRVGVRDVSPEGCKAELVERPDVGELLWVRFDGLEGLEARVCWTAGFVAGLRFVHPIHPAVFERMIEQMGGRTAQSRRA
jgi:hypothetical protein